MWRLVLCAAVLGLLAWAGVFQRQASLSWSEQELARINSLVLPPRDQLKQWVVSTGNKYWDDPEAAALGEALFFDKRLSGNGQVSCASCHFPSSGFADPQPLSFGIAPTKRHSPALLGAAWQPWQFWDGRADSLWAQALGPMEDPAEHGANRVQLAKLMVTFYGQRYREIFAELPSFEGLPKHATPAGNNPKWQENWELLSTQQQNQVNRVFANMGKSLAAYQSLLFPVDSRFDRFARELLSEGRSEKLNRDEQQGLKLFIDDQRGQCMRCHNGALFSNGDFQVTGIKDSNEPLGLGRQSGIELALNSAFNCRSSFSDVKDPNVDCAELSFAKRDSAELTFAFKVPTLRNVAQTAPYMHNGSLPTLGDVLHFYTRAVSQYSDEAKVQNNGVNAQHLDIEPLPLASRQLEQLEAFLKTLDGAAVLPNLDRTND